MANYSRVMLKLSGESLLGEREYGIDPQACVMVAKEIVPVVEQGIQVAIVVGGGNIFRGLPASKNGLERATADYIGMLGTIMNALALGQSLNEQGIKARVMTSLVSEEVAESFVRNKAIAHLQAGQVLVLGGGTGNPYFTTDSAAALRALELECDVVMKATKVDGVYTEDPIENPNAVRYESVTYDEVLGKNLNVMDMAAFALCRDNKLPVVVFDFFEQGNFIRAINGQVGTMVR